MTDRFENGDPTTTRGIHGGPLDHGFLPEDPGFHHGGDLAGLTDRLDYIAGLGVGAIWITPPFTNRTVQGNGTVEGSSSAYHGYWQIDLDRIDPHLGSEEDMHALIAAAHDAGLAVYFDIVVNHTGDVIRYAEDSSAYIAQQAARTSPPTAPPSTRPRSPADDFPELDPDVSFPYTPVFADAADAEAKSPDWLNDVTLYHNRGDSTFTGESSLYGDFFGLDDLFTEHPAVVEGMTELYADVIRRYDIDGFRIDTVKHVDRGFWEHFAPRIAEVAAEAGPDRLLRLRRGLRHRARSCCPSSPGPGCRRRSTSSSPGRCRPTSPRGSPVTGSPRRSTRTTGTPTIDGNASHAGHLLRQPRHGPDGAVHRPGQPVGRRRGPARPDAARVRSAVPGAGRAGRLLRRRAGVRRRRR